jgi:sugar/nucleoside kinase (ribokinase family)
MIKLGADGSLVHETTSDQVWKVHSLVGQIVDATGAGDAFCGGVAAALASGLDPLTAARAGTASASFAIGAFGALRDPALPEELVRRREMTEAEVLRPGPP